MHENRKILHIDDDPSIHRIVNKGLSKNGYEVLSTTDPTQALQKVLKTGARVVILDIDMPQIDGLSLLKQIKEHDGGIQVIMLTGLVSMNTILQSMRLGAEACIFKPVKDFNTLSSAVNAAFSKIENWWQSLHDLNDRKTNFVSTPESTSI